MGNVDNIFKDLAKKNEGKTQSAILFWLSLGLLLIGLNNFVEDTRSSFYGLITLEQTFGIQFGSWDLTYWAGSIFFQILTMIGMFIYIANTKTNRWALGMAGIAQVVDFATDVWYRSNSMVSIPAVIVGFVLTFIYFTVGSELSLTFGLSAVRYTIKDGLEQSLKLVAAIVYALVNAVSAGLRISKDYWNELEKHDGRGLSPKTFVQQNPTQKNNFPSNTQNQQVRNPAFAQDVQHNKGLTPAQKAHLNNLPPIQRPNNNGGGRPNDPKPFRQPTYDPHYPQHLSGAELSDED